MNRRAIYRACSQAIPSKSADRYAALCLMKQLPCHPKALKIDMFTYGNMQGFARGKAFQCTHARPLSAIFIRDRAALFPAGACVKQASFVSSLISSRRH